MPNYKAIIERINALLTDNKLYTVVYTILNQQKPRFVYIIRIAISDIPSADIIIADTFIAITTLVLRYYIKSFDPDTLRRFKLSKDPKAIIGYNAEDQNRFLILAIRFAFIRKQKKYPAVTASRLNF